MFRSSSLVTLIALSGSALGFVVQLIMARRYGIGVDVDAYLFALSVPMFIAGLVSAMMSYVLVPRLVACEVDPAYQKRYITTLIIGVVSLSLALSILGIVFGLLQGKMLPIDSPIRLYEGLPILISLGWIISASQIIHGCLAAILNANRSYLSGAILALFPYFGMLLLVLFLGEFAGITALPLGMLTGAIVATISGVFLIRRSLFPLQTKDLLWAEMRKIVFVAPYTTVAMICFTSYAVVDAYWAPQAGEGVLATLGYAQRLVIAFGNLAVAGPIAVLVPRFAELVREKELRKFRRLLKANLLLVGGIATATGFLLSVFSEELVKLMFAQGRFDTSEVSGVAKTLQNLIPGMVAMVMSAIVLKAMFCFNNMNKKAAILGLFWVTSYFLASAFFYQGGAPGIALGYSMVWIFYFIAALFMLLRISLPVKNHL